MDPSKEGKKICEVYPKTTTPMIVGKRRKSGIRTSEEKRHEEN